MLRIYFLAHFKILPGASLSTEKGYRDFIFHHVLVWNQIWCIFLWNTCFAFSCSHIWNIHPFLHVKDHIERPWDHVKKEKGPDKLSLLATFAKTNMKEAIIQFSHQLNTTKWSKLMLHGIDYSQSLVSAKSLMCRLWTY